MFRVRALGCLGFRVDERFTDIRLGFIPMANSMAFRVLRFWVGVYS